MARDNTPATTILFPRSIHASETVAALFPVFLIAILSCFLFPVTLYRIGRRFGLLSFLAVAGEDDEQGESKKMKKKSAGLSSSSSSSPPSLKKTNDIQIKAKDSPWAKAFEESVHQSRQSMKRQMVFSGWNLAIFLGWILFFALLFWAKQMQMEEKMAVRLGKTVTNPMLRVLKKLLLQFGLETEASLLIMARNVSGVISTEWD